LVEVSGICRRCRAKN